MAEDEPQEETTEQPESEEEIDIELEAPQQPRGRKGWSVGTVIVLLVIVAALAWYLFWAVGQAQEREQSAREAREQGYQAQLVKIGSDLAEAIEANEQGDVMAAIQALEAATSQIGGVTSSAAAAGDDEYSQIVSLKKQAAQRAVDEVTAKQTELQELLADKLREVQQELGVEQAKVAEPKEEEPTEPEEEESVEAGEEPAAPEETEEPTQPEPSAVQQTAPPRPPMSPPPPPR